MAGTEQDDLVSEADIFEGAFGAPEAEAPVKDEGSDASVGGPLRDEHGRFAAKSEDEAAEEVQEEPVAEAPEQEAPAEAEPVTEAKSDPKEDRDGWIPSWRLREISESRKAERERAEKAEADARAAAARWEASQRETAELKRRLDELSKPKTEPPKLFEDPEAWTGNVDQRFSDLEKRMEARERKLRLEHNLQLAAFVHKEHFQPAYDAFVAAVEGGDGALRDRVLTSADPGGSMVKWHRERKTLDALSDVGGDLTAYEQKVLDAALSNPDFLAKAAEALNKAKAPAQPSAQPGAQQPVQPTVRTKLPPSLRTMPGAAAASDGSGIQHMSDEELFNSALSR